MKRLFSIVIFLLGVAFITTSCEKEEIEPEIVPVYVPSNDSITWDTVAYNIPLGVMKADSTLKTLNGGSVVPNVSFYVSNSSYTIYLSEHIPNYVNIDGNISVIEFNKVQGDFYSIEYEELANDVKVNILCDYDAYQNNEHSIFGRIFTDSTVYEITLSFKLFDDATHAAFKGILNSGATNSLLFENSTGDTYEPFIYQSFQSSASTPVHELMFYNNYGTSTAKDPVPVQFANLSVTDQSNLAISIHNNTLRVQETSTGESDEYIIESVVGDKIYLNDGSNLYWITY